MVDYTTTNQSRKFLIGPVWDFFALGGLSVLLMISLIPFAGIEIDPKIGFIGVTLFLSSFINYPHFAHSYQIFYRNFRRKLGPETPKYLRYRYWFAGIWLPIGLGVSLIVFWVFQRVDLMAYAISLMGFLVGWHYVKQGYGIMIVNSVLKRNFFTLFEKRVFLINAYAAWIYMWILINREAFERDLLGIGYLVIQIPDTVYWLSLVAFVLMLAITTLLFLRRLLPGGQGVPFNGVIAYYTSIYIWLYAFQLNPLFVLLVPTFHSLQYLAVVGRFQYNVEASKSETSSAKTELIKFYFRGVLLGFVGFLGLPFLLFFLFEIAPGKPVLFLPVLAFWLFINIHHYFLDNVMWRKGNPDVSQHLFSNSR